MPSVGASAGMVIIWNSSFFEGKLIEARQYGIILEFRSKHTSEVWTLVLVYGPCQGPARDDFVQWLYHLDINWDDNWLLLGDSILCGRWKIVTYLGVMSAISFCLMK